MSPMGAESAVRVLDRWVRATSEFATLVLGTTSTGTGMCIHSSALRATIFQYSATMIGPALLELVLPVSIRMS